MLPVMKFGRRAGEELHGAVEVRRLAEATERDAAQHVLPDRRAVALVGVHPRGEVRAEHGRGDGVDVDAVRAPFDGQRLGQQVDRGLRRAVGGVVGQTELPAGGRHQDHLAAAALRRSSPGPRPGTAASVWRTLTSITVSQSAGSCSTIGAGDVGARAGDDDVEPAAGVDRRPDDPVHVVLGRRAHRRRWPTGRRRRAMAAGHGLQLLRVPAGQCDERRRRRPVRTRPARRRHRWRR